jgi:hypothetical protein
MGKFQGSQDTKEKIKLFEKADALFKSEWEIFELEQQDRLAYLEKLRDDRNAKLDEAKRSLRQDAEGIDDMRATFTEGPFKVQKKWSDYYIPEKLVSMLGERGLYDTAVASGIVAIKTEVAPYPQVKKFLEDSQLVKDFECCEDGEESSTAISGPKPIPPLATELKKE